MRMPQKAYPLARANSGRETLEWATRDLPKLIILDIMMPDSRGCIQAKH